MYNGYNRWVLLEVYMNMNYANCSKLTININLYKHLTIFFTSCCYCLSSLYDRTSSENPKVSTTFNKEL